MGKSPAEPALRRTAPNKPNLRGGDFEGKLLTGRMPVLRNTLRGHYGQDFCAKQTQFGQEPFRGQVLRRKGLAMHRTRGEPPQNKANCPRRGTQTVSLLRITDWGWSRIRAPACALLSLACMDRSYKQTQFPPLCRPGDRRSQGPIARNKPNSSIADLGLRIADRLAMGRLLRALPPWTRAGDCAKRSQSPPVRPTRGCSRWPDTSLRSA
jgi:hypothetical protein